LLHGIFVLNLPDYGCTESTSSPCVSEWTRYLIPEGAAYRSQHPMQGSAMSTEATQAMRGQILCLNDSIMSPHSCMSCKIPTPGPSIALLLWLPNTKRHVYEAPKPSRYRTNPNEKFVKHDKRKMNLPIRHITNHSSSYSSSPPSDSPLYS
jgi:hypothetical protein